MTQELGGEPALTMVADTSRMGRLQGTQAAIPWSLCGTCRNSMWEKKKKCPMMLKSKSQLGPLGPKGNLTGTILRKGASLVAQW